jgi:hypothetical protein
MSLGPHPILDTLISWEPEDSHVREVFGLGDRPLPTYYDPPTVITHAQVISSTPTGSLRLDQVTRSLSMRDALDLFRAGTMASIEGGR